MFICGINIQTLFQGESQAKQISGKVFDNEFMSCMDNTVKELYYDLKSYSTLTAANSQIHLNPGHKNNLKAFISGQGTRTAWYLIPL